MRLGDYDLLSELGRVGMGVVYRARHRATGAVRAVKVATRGADPESLARFRREAETLARVSGEGVVPVHEAGVDQGRLYLVMGLLEGGSLRARLATARRLPWREAASLVAAIARTLQRCHEASIIHRDLKPENVLFDEQGRTWLADFGAVRDLQAASLTETGAAIGTPSYMSPELLGGARANARDDIYSLGVILHELVTGELPFPRSTSIFALLHERLAAKREPIGASVPDAPAALDAVIARALERDGSRRHLTATELADELDAVLARKSGAPSRARVGVALALGLALVAAAIAGASWPRPKTAAPAPPPPPAPPVTRPPVVDEAIVRATRALGAGAIDEAERLWPDALAAAVDSGSRSSLARAACGAAARRAKWTEVGRDRAKPEELARSLVESGRALDLAWRADPEVAPPPETVGLAFYLRSVPHRAEYPERLLALELDLAVNAGGVAFDRFDAVFWDGYLWSDRLSAERASRLLRRAAPLGAKSLSLHFDQGVVHLGSALRRPAAESSLHLRRAHDELLLALDPALPNLASRVDVAIVCADVERSLGESADLDARVLELCQQPDAVARTEAERYLHILREQRAKYGEWRDPLSFALLASVEEFLHDPHAAETRRMVEELRSR